MGRLALLGYEHYCLSAFDKDGLIALFGWHGVFQPAANNFESVYKKDDDKRV